MLDQTATVCFNEKLLDSEEPFFCVRMSHGWGDEATGEFCLVRFIGKNFEVELYDP